MPFSSRARPGRRPGPALRRAAASSSDLSTFFCSSSLRLLWLRRPCARLRRRASRVPGRASAGGLLPAPPSCRRRPSLPPPSCRHGLLFGGLLVGGLLRLGGFLLASRSLASAFGSGFAAGAGRGRRGGRSAPARRRCSERRRRGGRRGAGRAAARRRAGGRGRRRRPRRPDAPALRRIHGRPDVGRRLRQRLGRRGQVRLHEGRQARRHAGRSAADDHRRDHHDELGLVLLVGAARNR